VEVFVLFSALDTDLRVNQVSDLRELDIGGHIATQSILANVLYIADTLPLKVGDLLAVISHAI
jgi:hypothetical protein